MQQDTRSVRPARGFTLLELLVAMSVFLVISAAAFRLFIQQQSSSDAVQGQVGLNLALRNAVSMMQMDITNAGSGYYQEANIASWPLGVTIVNNVVPAGQSCFIAATGTYGDQCFDRMNVITVTAAANATDSTGSAVGCSNTQPGTTFYIQKDPSAVSLAATALEFNRGDQVLFLNVQAKKMTTAVLTANSAVSGAAVKLTINATNADGSNARAKDPLDITTCYGNAPCTPGNRLATQFCGSDWVLKLSPTTYYVDRTIPTNPKLMRAQGGNAPTVVMEQVIGFKVGAATFNATNDQPQYNYDASTYFNTAVTDAYDFTLVRSLRVSLIGRTVPNQNSTFHYRNGFDQGPYQVQGIAVVVNPRNMSMND
jgi:prepilin-type N-terminal cleavage/methylation domain-containing protein